MLTTTEIRGFLQTCTPSVELDLYDESIRVLDLYSSTDYPDQIEILINSCQDDPADQLCSKIVEMSRNLVVDILMQQGIEVSDFALHSEINELARAVFEFPYFEDRQQIEDICDNGETDVEQLANLCSLVSSLSIEKTMSIVTGINIPEFGDFVKNLLYRIQEQDSNNQELSKIISSYKTFKNFIGQDTEVFADRFASNAQTIGLPYLFYFEQYRKHVSNPDIDFSAEKASGYGIELCALAYLSEDANGLPLPVIREHLEHFSSDLKNITAIDAAVTKLVMEATRAQN